MEAGRQRGERITGAVKQHIIVNVVERAGSWNPGGVPVGKANHVGFVRTLDCVDLVIQKVKLSMRSERVGFHAAIVHVICTRSGRPRVACFLEEHRPVISRRHVVGKILELPHGLV